jgi:putative endonuclease
MRNYFTYILASRRNGTLYVGVTNNLLKRIDEHKNKKASAFTKKYNVNKLVYYEECGDINAAIQREKQLKNWRRSWKIKLIEGFNPEWKDLYNKLMGLDPGSSPG